MGENAVPDDHLALPRHAKIKITSENSSPIKSLVSHNSPRGSGVELENLFPCGGLNKNHGDGAGGCWTEVDWGRKNLSK
jgi:hypothetical protein